MINKLLLCTDLDRTLIPNGAQPESSNARNQFRKLVNHSDITLVYVTGRDKALVQKAITYYNLPVPDYVISDVGATIYNLDNSEASNNKSDQPQWQIWQDWQSCFAIDWKGKTNTDIAELFSDITELRKQEVSKQKLYKLSYYVPLYIDYRTLMDNMYKRLLSAEVDAELIWSIDEPLGIGLLDVMPKHATKRNAIEFLMKKNRFDYSNTIFAGDSGNDLDVLLSPIQSILVANAHKDVKDIVMETINKTINHESIYLAKGGFKHMNGNYSAGILEGVQFYVPEIVQRLEEIE